LGKAGDAPGTFARFDMIAIDDRDPGRIIAAVLETAQSIKQDGRGFRFSDVSDNATHDLGASVTLTGVRRKEGGPQRPAPALAPNPNSAKAQAEEQEGNWNAALFSTTRFSVI
jgi:hypothetical protein